MELNAIKETTGTIFDMERFSFHDGPGIRTVVYLKGCPLRCGWCANPESNRVKPQIGFFAEKCGFCKSCVEVCPNGSYFLEKGNILWDACIGCLKCTDVCYYDARVAYGRTETADAVVKRVLRDKTFYDNSGGGVTLSGGEVSMQPEFAAAVLSLCQKEHIHTAIETSGFCKWEDFKKIIEHVNLLLFDLKCMDPKKHLQYTGVDNRVILDNACLASEMVEEMIIRWPVIPGVNDTEENVEAMADFILEKLPRVKRVDLLPYHSVGKSKCLRIGKEYGYEPPHELTEERVWQLCTFLEKRGLDARICG